MRFPLLFALLVAWTLGAHPLQAADLTVTVSEELAAQKAETITQTLANFLALQLTRVTFNVLTMDEVEASVERRLVTWAGGTPSAAERAEIDRQLLAEGSYYLTSLSYLIQAGGAVFPDDRPETSYAGDTLVRLDALQRQLSTGIAAGEDVSAALVEAERIRALTEGHTVPPLDFGPLSHHVDMLERAIMRAREGIPL